MRQLLMRYALQKFKQRGVRRSFCISSSECLPPVHGTCYSSRISSDDDRVFSFATVVVESMRQGQSTLPAFSQACSLLGTNDPTLAVVFVSKPTASALSAVEEVAKFFPEAAPRFGAPLIGCVGDLWQPGASASTSPPAGKGHDHRAKRLGPSGLSGSGFRGIPVAAPQGLTNCSGAAVDSADDQVADEEIADFQALLSESTKWTRDNPGVISDDESLATLEREIKSCSSSVKSFLAEQKKLALEKEGENEAGSVPVTSPAEAGPAVTVRLAAESQGTGSVETTGNTSEKETEESGDGGFRMMLCLGHLPGVKATAFHTSTTGVPHLPDMEAAVKANNPHMFLLGAPGYPFPEFVQRLSIIFPESSRAGAFMAPLYTAVRQETKSTKPLFYGTELTTTGVVGLAISSVDPHCKVPMAAFRELLRMSLGMTRITGQMFFDNAISNSLFLPKNVTVTRRADTKAPVDPTIYLKHLNAHLEKRMKVQSQTSVASVTSEPGDRGFHVTVDGTRTCTASLGMRHSYPHPTLMNTEVENDAQNDEKIPLALLDTVLFPGWSSPLHFQEPRYKHLVRHCVERGKPFGLTSYGHWQSPEELVGTMATLKVYLFEKDCRSYVAAHGTKRFRVLFNRMSVQPGSFGLTLGQVEFFDDAECENQGEVLDLAHRVVSRCKQYVPEAEQAPGLCEPITDPTKASFAVGQVLPVPVRVKRRWLGMVDTKFRLLEQMTFLDE